MLDILQPAAPNAGDWRWQLRNAVTDLATLEATLDLTDDERRGTERALQRGLPLSITPYYLSLIRRDDPDCPIRQQCVPTANESSVVAGDLRDPLGEEAHEVAPHLIQRYPDRALLLVTDRCSVYCRFCTRSRMVGQASGANSLATLGPALDYLRKTPEIKEVIISGGDPLAMATPRLARILEEVASIPSLVTVRVATRTPVTLPMRIDTELCRALRSHPAVWVMTHFNHPNELTEAARRACSMLVDHGLPVMNQTVLLRGINDRSDVLETLFRGLVGTRVRPYYLLQADPVRGTAHLRTPLRVGRQLMEALQGRISGIALPRFIVDTPGGMGKVPAGPSFIVREGPGRTTFRTHRGVEVTYQDPPASSENDTAH